MSDARVSVFNSIKKLIKCNAEQSSYEIIREPAHKNEDSLLNFKRNMSRLATDFFVV